LSKVPQYLLAAAGLFGAETPVLVTEPTGGAGGVALRAVGSGGGAWDVAEPTHRWTMVGMAARALR